MCSRLSEGHAQCSLEEQMQGIKWGDTTLLIQPDPAKDFSKYLMTLKEFKHFFTSLVNSVSSQEGVWTHKKHVKKRGLTRFTLHLHDRSQYGVI